MYIRTWIFTKQLLVKGPVGEGVLPVYMTGGLMESHIANPKKCMSLKIILHPPKK